MNEHTNSKERSIADLSRMLRGIIERETAGKHFWVEGEIQSFYQSDLGHCYFDLVDSESQIRCMLRDKQRGDIPFDLENRLQVRVYGDIQFYYKQTQVQISVKQIRLAHTAIKEAPGHRPTARGSALSADKATAAGKNPPHWLHHRTQQPRHRRL